MAAGSASRRGRPPRWLMVALLAVTVWGAIPPWVGPWVGWDVQNVPLSVELVDHALPAVILAAVAVAGLAGWLPLLVALVGVLAGLWMTATHVPLLGQAADGLVGWDAALFHSLPGILLLALTVAAAVWAWRDEGRIEQQAAAGASGRRDRR